LRKSTVPILVCASAGTLKKASNKMVKTVVRNNFMGIGKQNSRVKPTENWRALKLVQTKLHRVEGRALVGFKGKGRVGLTRLRVEPPGPTTSADPAPGR